MIYDTHWGEGLIAVWLIYRSSVTGTESVSLSVWCGNWVCHDATVDSLHKRTTWALGWERRGNKGIPAISGCQTLSTRISYILLLLEDGGWGRHLFWDLRAPILLTVNSMCRYAYQALWRSSPAIPHEF